MIKLILIAGHRASGFLHEFYQVFLPLNTILLHYVSTSNVDMKSLYLKYTCNNPRKELL
jgi:hypothetical protein